VTGLERERDFMILHPKLRPHQYTQHQRTPVNDPREREIPKQTDCVESCGNKDRNAVREKEPREIEIR